MEPNKELIDYCENEINEISSQKYLYTLLTAKQIKDFLKDLCNRKQINKINKMLPREGLMNGEITISYKEFICQTSPDRGAGIINNDRDKNKKVFVAIQEGEAHAVIDGGDPILCKCPDVYKVVRSFKITNVIPYKLIKYAIIILYYDSPQEIELFNFRQQAKIDEIYSKIYSTHKEAHLLERNIQNDLARERGDYPTGEEEQ